jgi:hypothetical protein
MVGVALYDNWKCDDAGDQAHFMEWKKKYVNVNQGFLTKLISENAVTFDQFHELPDDIFTSEICSRSIGNKKVCGSVDWMPVYVYFSCSTT